MLQYHIREMQRADLEEVTALEASCFSMPWKYKDFEEVLDNPNRFYLVAESEHLTLSAPDRILGGCMLSNIAGEGDISNVAVSAKYRNNKIGSELLSALMKLAKERYNITIFMLEVRSQNKAALRLYEKQGFISQGIRPGFYDRPKDDAVIMKKEGDLYT